MDKIDVVIVGGGLSGLSCAYRLSEDGLQVMVVERGDSPGSKNVTGGRIYLQPLKGIAEDMLKGAPFERRVTRERWSLLGDTNSITMDFTGQRLRENDHSYTLLRARFDGWLAERVMERGAYVIPKYRVDDLIFEGQRVAGIRAGKEDIYAHVVVASDGVISFMAEKAGLRGKMRPGAYAVGVKEVIELPEEKINDRFNLEKEEGVAHLFIGDVTKGAFGGGFLYTNKDTISIGVVVGINSLVEHTPTIECHRLIDDFTQRYELKRLIDGGKPVEYSAHLIPEAGYNGVPRPFGDGIILTGDAAGLALNMGITVRGMEFAIASGIMAAETIIEARKRGDYSATTLSSYEKRLKEGFVLQDLYAARKMPAFLANEDLFSFYPKTIPQLIERVIWFGNAPKGPLGKTIWDGLKSSGMLKFRRLKEIYRLKDI